jgi:hypothetical protein
MAVFDDHCIRAHLKSTATGDVDAVAMRMDIIPDIQRLKDGTACKVSHYGPVELKTILPSIADAIVDDIGHKIASASTLC